MPYCSVDIFESTLYKHQIQISFCHARASSFTKYVKYIYSHMKFELCFIGRLTPIRQFTQDSKECQCSFNEITKTRFRQEKKI